MASETGMVQALRDVGRVVQAGSNAPLLLEDPDVVYLVLEGAMDVFAVPVADGRAGGPRDYLFSVSAGDVLFGMEPSWADDVGLLAVGNVGTAVAIVTLADFKRLASDHSGDACAMIDEYVADFATSVSERSTPRFDLLLSAGEQHEVPKGADVGAKRGTVWVRFDEGVLLFDGYFALPVRPEDGPFPLAAGGWACANENLALSSVGASEVFEDGTIWPGLRSFQRIALEWADVIVRRDRSESRDQLLARVDADLRANTRALDDLANVMSTGTRPDDFGDADEVFSACRLVAEAMNIELRPAPARDGGVPPLHAVRAIMHASGVGFRDVVLGSDWWRRDQGPLVAFLLEEKESNENAAETHQRIADVFPHGLEAGRVHETQNEWEDEMDDRRPVPIALLPTKAGSYELVDVRTDTRVLVDEDVAEGMSAFGVQLYRSLPARPIGLKDLWEFNTFGARVDATKVIVLGLAGAVLGLLLPMLTGYLFDTVIPGASRPGLVQVFVALVVAALSAGAFEITRTIAVLRLHTRIGSALQLAILARLVRLPLTFFRRFNAGDLGDRASGINAIGDQLNSAAISGVLSSFVAAGSYALLFYYSRGLALVATAILAANIIFTAVTSAFALRYAREEQEAQGLLSGLVLQLLDGIAKLRVSGTEARAFSRWARAFRRQQAVGYKFGMFQNHVTVFNSMLTIVSTLVLYWSYSMLARDPAAGITTGQFIAFNSAFGTFIAAGMALTQTAIGFLNVIPMWERAKPILEAQPEVDVSMADPGELTGSIEVSQLTFRYDPEGAVILNDVSLTARPGEFVAVVGPSGAGKSTLLRILLGFEKVRPSSVFVDGHDLSTVDIGAVRRQIGVVLQSSSLTAGDIFTNIVGQSALTVEDAWRAATMAGLEPDLKALPMGLHTVLPEGGSTLSGGQRQRLLIARALVHEPRILYFDEATSALDNRTQAIVSESIEGLRATRIVIAHRLSTIRDADRIYVMDGGRVVQEGTFEELMAEAGMFADLAARQEV